MKIAVGCDHAGFALKQTVVEAIQSLGHTVFDCGTNNCDRVDYPDYAALAAEAIQQGRCDRAILICGSGVGVCITANKFTSIRACVCHDCYSAHQSVEHDNLNVLCLGARIIGPGLAKEIVIQFLNACFSAGARHEARLAKVSKIEQQNFK